MKRLLAAVIALATLALPASADTGVVSDPNDTRGPLDIKRIAHGHASNDVLWHKVVMHNRWGAKDLQGSDEIRFQISTDGEDRYDEVNAVVAVTDGKLGAWIFEYIEGSDYGSVGPSKRIRFTRPSRRAIKIFFNESWVANHRERYLWAVGAYYRDEDSRFCQRECDDYAPARIPGRLVHNL